MNYTDTIITTQWSGAQPNGRGNLTADKVTYQEIMKRDLGVAETVKLRITVRSDSYVKQSYARIERWNGECWQKVHTIAGDAMRSKLAYATRVDDSMIQADRSKLLEIASAVVFD